ncbi:MAG: S41 family peptidase [Clostridia bacterium]|nr:S41 family peptidase [Clostridia bacterium]
MKKRISLLGCISLCVLAAVLTFQLTFHFVAGRYQEKLDTVSSGGSDFSRLSELSALIRKNYLGTVDDSALEDGALRGYVEGLNDPYSRYLNPEEYEVYKQSLSGAASGVGIRASQEPETGRVVVYDVLASSPAEEAGIRKGDVLYRVDDVLVSELGFYKSMRALSGESGTKVKVSFLREVAAQEMELAFTLTRKEIKINSISREMLADTVGYIQIFSFDLGTDEEFKTAVDSLTEEGATSLVIDLRNNGGGSLDAATRMLDLILPAGVMYYRTGGNGTEVAVESDAQRIDLPIVALMNENTASAAELFAAVLKDKGAAKLVGTKSFGKGNGQRVLELEDGSALIVTSEQFRPAGGESFNGKGVIPDAEVKLEGESVYFVTRAKDDQLQEAIRLVKE